MHCIVSIEVIFDRRPQKEVNRRAEGACQLLILRNTFKHIKGVRKKWIFFMVRLIVRGWRPPAPSALTVSKCENSDPFLAVQDATFLTVDKPR